MRHKFVSTTLLLILFVPTISFAADIKNFFIRIDNEKKSCYMAEVGIQSIPNAKKFNGKFLGVDNCVVVSFSTAEFYKNFDFCALSGIQTIYVDESIDCSVNYATSSNWIEFSLRGVNKCHFVCKTK